MSDPRITERLRMCLDSGGLVGLFPLLAAWTNKELNELLCDITSYHRLVQQDIDREWAKIAFSPSVFLSRTFSEQIDNAKGKAEIEVFSVLAEISSVAEFYLYRRPRA